MKEPEFGGSRARLISTDELTEETTPSRMEEFTAEVREFNRVDKAERAKKRARRQRKKAGRKNNRKRK